MSSTGFPPNAAHFRRARGWSQVELARQSGVSRTEISAIETGRLVPSVAVALRVAAALGHPVEVVFGSQPAAALVDWAWPPETGRRDGRAWQAAVGRRILSYPVEGTAAGTLAHDGWSDGHAWHARSEEPLPGRTLVVAGCDPLVGLLVREMAARHQIRVLPLLRSSTEAVALLRQGVVHAAGLHYSDLAGQASNDQAVSSALGRGYRLVHQVRWDAGIAVVADRRERTPSALLRANVRWVNREEGSAARRTFDALLASRRRPAGYGHVVRDHRSVAATVSSGWAQAGVCVRAAAAEARLSFIPVQQEAYELCVPDAGTDDPRIAALLATLRSTAYRQLLADVPGCVVRDTGDVRSVH